MNGTRVNHVAVIVAAIAYWVIGAIWYSPVLFGNRWLALIGKSLPETKPYTYAPYIVALLANILLGYVLAGALIRMQVSSAGQGALLGFLFWLGFVATTSLTEYLFEARPLGLLAINSGYPLVGMVIMGAILAVWKARGGPDAA